jgi:hypothetical protein
VRGQRHGPATFYPRERPGTHRTGVRAGPRARLDRGGKSRPIGIKSPDRSARSQSLYRLSYSAHSKSYWTSLNARFLYNVQNKNYSDNRRIRKQSAFFSVGIQVSVSHQPYYFPVILVTIPDKLVELWGGWGTQQIQPECPIKRRTPMSN